MADAPKAYLLNEDGKVEAVDADDAPDYLSTGYVPAGKSQIEDYKREEAFHAKYGTTGQQLKTFGEGAAQNLTLGASTWAERALGVNPEDIKARQEENPKSHLAGSIAGVALPLIATAGAAALPEGLAGAAELTAPSLISGLGESASEGVAGLLGEGATSAVGRIAAKAAAAGAGSAIEGAAYGLGQVVHESALGDPNLTASRMLEEVGLSALLGGGIGAGMGALGQLVGETANSKLGQKLEEWADTFEGNQNIKTAAGPGKGQAALKGLYKRMSPQEASKLGQEAGEMGLIGPLDKPASVYEKAGETMEKSGQEMGNILDTADTLAPKAQPSAARVFSRFRNEVLAPAAENPLEAGTASKLEAIANAYEEKFGAANPENKMSLTELHQLRKQVSDKIYGLRGVADPEANALKASLHDFRNILSDELKAGVEKANLPAQTLGDWLKASREYHVAATLSSIAEKGMAGQGLSGVPLSAILTSGAGLIHGGPLGAAALGLGTMAAKRYGPQVLAAGARVARKLVDEGAAEGLASKTAEAISEAREAATEAGVSTRAAQLWGKLTEKVGEPVGGPAKDLLRDTAQEHIAERGAEGGAEGGAESSTEGPHGTPVETVAALSHMERASQKVQNRVGDGVAALVHGAPKVARGEAMAGVAATFSKSTEDAHATYAKRAEKLRQLAANPQLLQERLGQAASGMDAHAPETAQALQVAMARAVNVLNGALPPVQPHAPLEKPLPPSPDKVAAFNRVFEVVEKPSRLLKQAAGGVLTPEAVTAVKQAHPQYYADMQAAVLHKLSTHKGPIPYTQRQMLSLLMGQDMDGTQSPQAIAAHQAAFAVASPQQGSPAIQPTSKGLGKLKQSTRLLTPAQASAQRGNGGD